MQMIVHHLGGVNFNSSIAASRNFGGGTKLLGASSWTHLVCDFQKQHPASAAFPLKFLTASCLGSSVFYICIDVELIRSFLDAEADKLQTLMARYFHAFKIAWANEDCFVCM